MKCVVSGGFSGGELAPGKAGGAQDLIVCNHWECAAALTHYYHGKTPLVTLPPLVNHPFHRYDLVRTQMMQPDPVAPVLAQIQATLSAGHRVWLSGDLTVPADDAVPVVVPPARVVDGHWPDSQAYYLAWEMQANHLLEKHAVVARAVPVTDGWPVMNYECLDLVGFQGWH